MAKKSKPKTKKKESKPHEITLTLTLREQDNGFFFFRQDFIKGTHGKREMSLQSGAGCGNPFLFFRLEENGKVYRYDADASELIIQFANRSKELKETKY